VVHRLAIAEVVILRPVLPATHRPSLSIVIPARNESGNLPGLLERLESLPASKVEVIFVEGNSTDDTWPRIQELVKAYRGPLAVRGLQQKGKGKKDAVEVGFAAATGELLTILDADLTVAPEKITEFYEAYCRGNGDLINGNRLVYPREDGAMRLLNWVGNVFFGKALSYVLDIRIGDSLCGTKLFSRRHYQAILRWNEAFGDFDPFGDFALLFSAASLGLGVTDLPVHYGARTYGTTNIQRFRHGFQLLRMTSIGFFRIKLGP
jgi:glycosyltransferase involved in cell wall biosynthesis